MLQVFFWLCVGHALADYPLQGDFLSEAKAGKWEQHGVHWWIALTMHVLIHAGAVAFVTQSLALGLAEGALHFVIDLGKLRGYTTFRVDQALHILCKVAWALLAVWLL